MWLTPLKAEDTAMLAPRKAEGSAPHSTQGGGYVTPERRESSRLR